MGANPQPVCGSQGAAPIPTSIGWWIAAIVALGSIVGGAVQGAKVVGESVAAPLTTIIGISAPAAVWLAAVAGAVIAWVFVFSFWWDRCLSSPDSLRACSAGVIDAIVPSFASTVDTVFAFTAQHDRVDVVVKSAYWRLVETNAQWVHCAADADMSPILRGYYKNSAVCGAGAGAATGGIVGAIGGIIAGAAIGAAIGCATIILCILAVIVAFLIAVVCVIVAAVVGGQIGRAASGGAPPAAVTGQTLGTGDYVTTKGGLVTLGDAEGARAYWFVTETTLHGTSTGSPEFSFRDPDANLNPDAC